MASITPKAAAAIALLEQVRARIRMYVHPLEIDTVQCFLTGFEVAMTLSGIRWDKDAVHAVHTSRGIKESATGPIPQLKNRDLTTLQIIDELFAMEIEMIRESNRME